MVARPSSPVRSANAGEFSPSVAGRVDIKQYYSAGLAYKNIEPVPQGGFRRMGGTWRIGVWRRPLVDLEITGAALDTDPHTGTATIWTGTVAGNVAAVLAAGLEISAGTASITVEAEVSGVWTTVAGPFAVAAGTAVTRLAAFAPGGQKAATGLRILATFSEEAAASGLTVTAFEESGEAARPRYVQLTTDEGHALSCFVTAGIADFFTRDGYKGSARLADVTAAMLPDLGFYAEADTIGIFHAELETRRLTLMASDQLHDWRVDPWPYDPVPRADLGGDYTKTDDKWQITIRWSEGGYLAININVNGETTADVTLLDSEGAPIDVNAAASSALWLDWCARIGSAIEGLAAMGPTVTVTYDKLWWWEGTGGLILTVVLGGDLSGEEYQLSALIGNRASASALAYHIQIGETEYEDLFSAARGWPGAAALLQDRMGYNRIAAMPGAQALSRVAEYFDLNTDGVTDDAARLDRLRSQTSETILHIKESSYFFSLTDRGAYFVPNRTIDRNTPLNFVRCSEIGAQPNCRPFDLEGALHYVAIAEKGLVDYGAGGNQLLRLDESAVTSATSFEANPVSLLASHLVAKVLRAAAQKAQTDLDASRGWLMRADGRLVCGQFIRNQDITGFCEWVAAASGLVREIGVDGENGLWLAVMRGEGSIERYDTNLMLQDAVEASADLAGVVSGLPYEDGAELWAVADGYVLGPFSCASGKIDLEDAYTDIVVGRWRAPRWESMPQVYVTPGDDVVWRPGRVHTVDLNVIETTSLAVGANGSAPVAVTLQEIGDPMDEPMPAKTKQVSVSGADLPGYMTGTTVVVTQTRPGDLYVRDLAIGAKL